MRLDVPDEVRQETTRCLHSLSCLATGKCGNRDRCSVLYIDGRNTLVLASTEPAPCPYRASAGSAQLCTCPTHYAICVNAEA